MTAQFTFGRKPEHARDRIDNSNKTSAGKARRRPLPQRKADVYGAADVRKFLRAATIEPGLLRQSHSHEVVHTTKGTRPHQRRPPFLKIKFVLLRCGSEQFTEK